MWQESTLACPGVYSYQTIADCIVKEVRRSSLSGPDLHTHPALLGCNVNAYRAHGVAALVGDVCWRCEFAEWGIGALKGAALCVGQGTELAQGCRILLNLHSVICKGTGVVRGLFPATIKSIANKKAISV